MAFTLTYTPPDGKPDTRKFSEWGIHPHWILQRHPDGNTLTLRLQPHSKGMQIFKPGGKCEVTDHGGKVVYSGELLWVPDAIFKTTKGHLVKFK